MKNPLIWFIGCIIALMLVLSGCELTARQVGYNTFYVTPGFQNIHNLKAPVEPSIYKPNGITVMDKAIVKHSKKHKPCGCK